MLLHRPNAPLYVVRWERLLAALRGTLDHAIFDRWFMRTVRLSEEEGGRVCRVEVDGPLTLEMLTQPRFQRVVERALRYEGAEVVEVGAWCGRESLIALMTLISAISDSG